MLNSAIFVKGFNTELKSKMTNYLKKTNQEVHLSLADIMQQHANGTLDPNQTYKLDFTFLKGINMRKFGLPDAYVQL